MNYYFPVHLDGGNRGCEGISKGTAKILHLPKENLIALCRDVGLDTRLGIDKYVTLQKYKKWTSFFKCINKIYIILFNLLGFDRYSQNGLSRWYTYGGFINQMTPHDVLISTGGDMMCYEDNFIIYTTEEAKKRHCKTILWGCSMGENNLSQRKKRLLESFDLIYARESLSYNFFKSLGLKNVICYPDPAFSLCPEKVELPICFSKGKVIGINLSNFTVGDFSLNTAFGEEVRKLFIYIFEKTNYHILLIPHVVWKDQDDRKMALSVKSEFDAKYENRISILEIDELNYLQIRYIISQCELFVGGRTHAVISAYSTCIPTIALGYSIKSKGIATDLGLPDFLVIDTRKNKFEGELLSSFIYLNANKQEIKSHLQKVIPAYKEKLNNIKIPF